MTSDPESRLFDFAASNRVATNEEENTVTELHAALGTTGVPLRLRRPPTPAPTRPRRHYAFAAVTVALVLAVATASLFAIRQESTTPPPTEVPEVVLGLSGQESASPVAAEVCDFTGDVPLFAGADTSPIDGPSVLVTSDGELMLVCNDEETLLAENVVMATATQTPHVLQAITQQGNLLINIVTEESLFIPPGENTSRQRISEQPWGDWMVANSTDDPDRASLYNLETLVEHPLEVRGNRIGLDPISSVSVSVSGETAAITVTFENETGTDYLSGFFIALDDGSSQFYSAAPSTAPTQTQISNDGETIALTSFQGSMQSGITTVSIYEVETHSVLRSWELETPDTFIDLAWIENGSALLFTDGTALYKATDAEAEPEILFEGENVQGLMFTPDEDVVAIGHVDSTNSVPAKPQTSIINLETEEVTTLDGRDMWAGPTFTATRTTLMLTDFYAAPGDERIITAVDSSTGDSVGEIEYTIPEQNGFSNSSWGTGRGDITVMGFSPESMWELVDEDGNATLQQIPPPPMDTNAEQAVMLIVSPEDFLSLHTFQPTTTWIMLPGEDEWMRVELTEPEESEGLMPGLSFILGDD